MSKFNQLRSGSVVPVTSPIQSTPTMASTHEGGSGFGRDPKSELFLLAVSRFSSEDTFYEQKSDSDKRFAQLIHINAQRDPDWTARFLKWLRSEGNMRTASIVGAAEFVRASLATGGAVELLSGVTNRAVVASVLQRADEPGELLAYWISKYGKNIPKPIKRGIGDAVEKLYTEFNYLKWDSDKRSVRFADVLEMTHPSTGERPLFKKIIDDRHNREGQLISYGLPMLRARAELMSVPVLQRRALLHTPETLASAGMTWESVAGWLQGPMDAQAWEAIIPSMGYMALLRNLRNFEQANISQSSTDYVNAFLSNPERVAKSRQFPFRFLAAYKNTHSLKWGQSLENALNHSLKNIPELDGKTLILIDTSGSMKFSNSKNTEMTFMDSAILFGLAVAQRCEKPTVVSYSSISQEFPIIKGESLLKAMQRFEPLRFQAGTNTWGAVSKHYTNHDRIIIVTDEQSHDYYGQYRAPENVPMYVWNLAGYRYGTMPSGKGNRHTFGGLTDQAFRMIPLLEAGQSQEWPF